MRINIHDLRRMKQAGEKITMMTCYDHASARIIDEVGIPMILVGDSLGMVVLGHDSTLRVDLDMMIHHSQAVARGSKRAMIVIDLPFATYSSSDLSFVIEYCKTRNGRRPRPSCKDRRRSSHGTRGRHLGCLRNSSDGPHRPNPAKYSHDRWFPRSGPQR